VSQNNDGGLIRARRVLTELEFSHFLWYDACREPKMPFAVAAARATAGLTQGALPDQVVVRQSRSHPTLKLGERMVLLCERSAVFPAQETQGGVL
jgi:hypothetical protein